MTSYDLAIIGCGAAAFSAAIKASELTGGKISIAMVGSGELGGTCVNSGCVPSKYLLEASHAFFYPRRSRFRGISSVQPELDFQELMEGVRKLVKEMREAKYEKVIRYYPNVKLIRGKAKFRNEEELEISDGRETVKAKKVIIATGSRPAIPSIEGLEQSGFLTSDNLWELKEKPQSLAIIGGSSVGLEIGQAFLHFGSDVTIIEATDRIAYNAEPEISSLLRSSLESEGMNFLLNSRVRKVGVNGRKKVLEVVTARGARYLEVDQILVAAGRKPNTDSLAIERARVITDEKGFIVVNDKLQTSNENIYAAGDCISKKLMLETLAAREGAIAAENILGYNKRIDYSAIPWAIFTNPQIASVGFTEEEFMKNFGSCSCRAIKLDDVPKANMLGEKGLVKIVINPENGKIAGIHVLSMMASEFAVEGAIAIKQGFTFEDLIDTVHIFPTLAESVKLAAQSFVRSLDRMSCCIE